MLEIPEAYTLAKELEKEFCLQTVTFALAAHDSHGFAFYSHEAKEYPLLLEGKTLESVQAFAGQVALMFDTVRLVFSDGINMRLQKHSDALPKKVSVLSPL
jgi:formamidopyrimidine-DNA glycosylase